MEQLLKTVALIQIVCFLFLHAACDNYVSPRAPKLGPTIVEKSFNVDDDVVALNQATTASDRKKISALLTSRTYAQRKAIADAYKKKYGDEALMNDLFAASGKAHDYSDDLKRFFSPVTEVLAGYIASSLSLSHDWGYMTILCTSSEDRLKAFNSLSYYYAKDDATISLKELIQRGLRQEGGRTVLHTLTDPNPRLRPMSGVDQSKINAQVKLIPKSEGDCAATNNDLLMFMTKESFDQIQAVAAAYSKANNGANVLDNIYKYCEGDVYQAYMRIVNYSVDPFGYFANDLHVGVKPYTSGFNQDKYFLQFAAFIVAWSRCEIDLKDVEDAYNRNYNKLLLEQIDYYEDDSDDNNLLYGLLKGNNQ